MVHYLEYKPVLHYMEYHNMITDFQNRLLLLLSHHIVNDCLGPLLLGLYPVINICPSKCFSLSKWSILLILYRVSCAAMTFSFAFNPIFCQSGANPRSFLSNRLCPARYSRNFVTRESASRISVLVFAPEQLLDKAKRTG